MNDFETQWKMILKSCIFAFECRAVAFGIQNWLDLGSGIIDLGMLWELISGFGNIDFEIGSKLILGARIFDFGNHWKLILGSVCDWFRSQKNQITPRFTNHFFLIFNQKLLLASQ